MLDRHSEPLPLARPSGLCKPAFKLTDRLGYYVTNPMLRYSSLTLAGAIRLSLA